MNKPLLVVATTVVLATSCQDPHRAATLSPSPPGSGQGLAVMVKDSGPMVLRLGDGRLANSGSSIHRKSYIINDPACPVELRNASITAATKHDGFRVIHRFLSSGVLTTRKELRAFQIDYIVLDVFGEVVGRLSETAITDVPRGSVVSLGGAWNCDKRAAVTAHSSIAFLRSARFSDDTVSTANVDVLEHFLRKVPPLSVVKHGVFADMSFRSNIAGWDN